MHRSIRASLAVALAGLGAVTSCGGDSSDGSGASRAGAGVAGKGGSGGVGGLTAGAGASAGSNASGGTESGGRAGRGSGGVSGAGVVAGRGGGAEGGSSAGVGAGSGSSGDGGRADGGSGGDAGSAASAGLCAGKQCGDGEFCCGPQACAVCRSELASPVCPDACDVEPACEMDCAGGFTCCGDACVNTANDIDNCGGCGIRCEGTFPYCDNGTCGTPSCNEDVECGNGEQCCAGACCSAGSLCCVVPGGPVAPPFCTEPAQGTCPAGCPTCP